ncbi:MAG: PorP/SprF family type IX secretion system membrane protein [Bacteroidia bacterium]|nr:PorP/SprF family type IX secretion system membrane protein [Bacteroidia bacterium]
MNFRPFYYLTALVLIFIANGQDIHFTNFSAFPLNLSPSYTGFFDEDYRCGGGYRQQWRTVPVNYRTLSVWGDMNIKTLFADDNKYLSVGVLLNNDRAGDLRYGATQFMVPLAFHFKPDSAWHFSAGTATGLMQTGFDAARMTTDQQFDGYYHNPSLPAGEQFQFNSFYSFLWNLGAGVRYEGHKNHAFMIHLAAHQPHNPKVSFQEKRLNYIDPRLTVVPSYTFLSSNSKANFQAEMLMQFQGKYKEFIPKFGTQYFLQTLTNQSLLFHVSSRLRDALMLHGAYTYKSWYAGISYDLNLSRFRIATSGRGAWEIFVIKTFRSAYVPLIRKKPCPVFM